MTEAHIVGWGHTKFGRHDTKSFEDLVVDAAREAIAHAGIAAADIGGIWIGHFNNGLVVDGFVVHGALGG